MAFVYSYENDRELTGKKNKAEQNLAAKKNDYHGS